MLRPVREGGQNRALDSAHRQVLLLGVEGRLPPARGGADAGSDGLGHAHAASSRGWPGDHRGPHRNNSGLHFPVPVEDPDVHRYRTRSRNAATAAMPTTKSLSSLRDERARFRNCGGSWDHQDHSGPGGWAR